MTPMGFFRCWLVAAVAFTLCAAPHADRIFVNGAVWTGVPGAPVAEALAIGGDRILAAGTNRAIRALASPDTALYDLKGRMVVPGFNDAHWHFSASSHADLMDVPNLAELTARLREHARTRPETGWITGRGWGYAAFPGGVPHRKYLDAVFPDRPVYLWERDGHMGLANSAALALAKIDRNTPDPPYGRIVRDATGEPTGELQESAQSAVTRLTPSPSFEERYEALKRLIRRAASYGLTSLQVASALPPLDQAAFERVLAEGSLDVRFYVAVPLRKGATPADLEPYRLLRSRYQGPLLKFGSAKGVLDGTVDAKTAVMLGPYVGGGNGIANYTEDELDQAVQLYDREGFQIFLHAIGDKAIRMALDAYEKAARVNGTSGRRHRVEHVEVPAPEDVPRFGALGVIASTQALFAEPDETTLTNYDRLLGPERARRALAFRSLDAAGAVQAFGSDFPVFSMEVLRGVFCAVTRTMRDGTPKGGHFPEERISVEAALRHFTADAAYASFDEKVKGTLEPGKLADFVVLSENILTGNPEKILKARVLLTVMGGRETYRAE